MTYQDLQLENKALLKRMEELTAIIIAIELEGKGYIYGSIREVLQAGSSRADAYRKERKVLLAEFRDNLDKLDVFLMTAEKRSKLIDILKKIEV